MQINFIKRSFVYSNVTPLNSGCLLDVCTIWLRINCWLSILDFLSTCYELIDKICLSLKVGSATLTIPLDYLIILNFSPYKSCKNIVHCPTSQEKDIHLNFLLLAKEGLFSYLVNLFCKKNINKMNKYSAQNM